EATWTYATQLLGRGNPDAALPYLEAVDAASLTTGRPRALYYRDLAEARLFTGDPAGAATAADEATRELTHQAVIAQFRDADRYASQRTLGALAAAGHDDSGVLRQIALDDARAPSADAWYLLGWLAERHGDTSEAHEAFRSYLTLAPRWAFLREATAMRD